MAGTPLRPPQQERSRVTWERILEAGVSILEEEGYDGLTIAALCQRADVTAPTIYARAPDKEALLLAVYEHAVARLDAASALGNATNVREAVRALAAAFLDNARLLRAIVHRAALDPQIFRRGSETSIELGRRFRAAAGTDERAADACFRVVLAALSQRVVYGPQFESDLKRSDEELVEMLCDMCERYLDASC